MTKDRATSSCSGRNVKITNLVLLYAFCHTDKELVLPSFVLTFIISSRNVGRGDIPTGSNEFYQLLAVAFSSSSKKDSCRHLIFFIFFILIMLILGLQGMNLILLPPKSVAVQLFRNLGVSFVFAY
jgi:hypothetical protein